jgi:aldehyde:ferredoxin oxidoreductase
LGQGVSHFLKTHRDAKGYIAKNLSVPSSGSIPIPDWTLGAVVSVRGGDHLKHFTFLTRSSQGSKRAQEYSKIFLGVSPSPMNSLEHKGRFVWFHENYVATLNSLGLCAYPFVKLADIPYLAALTKVYNSVYKVNLTPQDLFVAGERIVQLQRAFNSREGIRRDEQSISASLLNHIGKILNHPGMLDEYYYFRGYHPSGLPSSERIKAVNLNFLIADLNISSDNRSKNSQFDLSNLPNLDEEKQ